MNKIVLIAAVSAAMLLTGCDNTTAPVGPGTNPPADGGEPKPDVDKQ